MSSQLTGKVRFTRNCIAHGGDFGALTDDVPLSLPSHQQPVVAVDGSAYELGRLILPDHVLIQELLDFPGLEQLEIGRKAGFVLALLLLLENLARLCDTLVADMGMDTRNHQVHVLFVATAERAGYFSHKVCFCTASLPANVRIFGRSGSEPSGPAYCFGSRTSSIMPYSLASDALIQ